MKYLSDIMEDSQTQLFKDTGTFFAFSADQFYNNERFVKGTKYIDAGAGMYVPKDNYKTLADGLERIHKEAVLEDIKMHGTQAIIDRELWNYECFFSSDISDAVDKLKPYPGITREDIRLRYNALLQTDAVQNSF